MIYRLLILVIFFLAPLNIQLVAAENIGISATDTVIGHSFWNTDRAEPEVKPVVLKATQPEERLLLGQKRSIDLIEMTEATALGFEVQKLNEIFTTEAQSLDDFFIFRNFILGWKDRVSKTVKFWFAVIPKSNDLVTDVIYQSEWFHQGVGGHHQLRMKLNPSVLIIPLNPQGQVTLPSNAMDVMDLTRSSIQELNSASSPSLIPGDIIYTLQATRTENGPQDWSPGQGLVGSFANSYTIVSTAHHADDLIHRNLLEQYRLDISDHQIKNRIFEYALNYSHEQQERQIYNLVFQACVAGALRPLRAPEQNGSFSGLDINIHQFNPYVVNKYIATNLPGESLPSMNEEFNGRVQSLFDINAFQDIEGGPSAQEQQQAAQQANTNFQEKYLSHVLSPGFHYVSKEFALMVIQEELTDEEVESLLKDLSRLKEDDLENKSPAEVMVLAKASMAENPTYHEHQQAIVGVLEKSILILVQTGTIPQLPPIFGALSMMNVDS